MHYPGGGGVLSRIAMPDAEMHKYDTATGYGTAYGETKLESG